MCACALSSRVCVCAHTLSVYIHRDVQEMATIGWKRKLDERDASEAEVRGGKPLRNKESTTLRGETVVNFL